MAAIPVAVTQPTLSADVRQNGRTVRTAMREAADQGARLVLFPEGMVTGYPKAQLADWSGTDWSVVTAELRAVARLAGELRLWVVLGSAHPLSGPHRPHNSLYVISDRGQLVDRYDKRFCSATENTRFFSPGRRSVTFDVDGYRFGCVLCFEINFPTLFETYAELGVDCLLLAAYPIDTIFLTKARAHAAIHCSWVVLSVPRQCEHLMASSVIGPDGQLAAQVGPEDLLVTTDLDRDDPALDLALHKARPGRAAQRLPGYYDTAATRDDERSRDRSRF